MQYMGSKNRICKFILPIIQDAIDFHNITAYLEPFVGGANVIDKIECKNRLGSDNNKYLIALLQEAQKDGFVDKIPETILFDEYCKVRTSYNKNTSDYENWYKGFVAFSSYSCRGFSGGYARNSRDDVTGERVRVYVDNLKNQVPKLKDIRFKYSDYKDLDIAKINNMVIYCDPPYKGTKQYDTSKNFDYEAFYRWCELLSQRNIVFVSEYYGSVPEHWELLWHGELKTTLNSLKKSGDNALTRVETLSKVKSL